MAKSTRAHGASYTPEELADPNPPEVIIQRAEIGFVDRKEEKPLAGSNSSQSSEKDSKSSDSDKQSHRQPARTTGNRSARQAKEADSTAHSTDGDGQKTTTRQSGSSRARSRSVDDEFDDDDF